MDKYGNTGDSVIMEQGDMGLLCTPLSTEDQLVYNESKKDLKKDDESQETKS